MKQNTAYILMRGRYPVDGGMFNSRKALRQWAEEVLGDWEDVTNSGHWVKPIRFVSGKTDYNQNISIRVEG